MGWAEPAPACRSPSPEETSVKISSQTMMKPSQTMMKFAAQCAHEHCIIIHIQHYSPLAEELPAHQE